MKIYQLHKYSGEYDFFNDIIIGSYLRKKKAEKEKFKAEEKEKELIRYSKKCANCPFLEYPFTNIEDLLKKHPDYCLKAKLEVGEYGINCENYYINWDNAVYKIVEIEVEE